MQLDALFRIESGRHDASSDQLDRVLAPIGWRLAVLPTRATTAAATGDDVRQFLGKGDERGAFRRLLQLNDDLARAVGAVRVALAVTPAPATGDARYDAFIAALVEHHLAGGGLPIPDWTSEPSRFVKPVWFVVDIPSFRDDALVTSPAGFVRHGVIVGERELTSR